MIRWSMWSPGTNNISIWGCSKAWTLIIQQRWTWPPLCRVHTSMDFVIWNKKQWLPYFFLQACTLYYRRLLKPTHGIARLAVDRRKKGGRQYQTVWHHSQDEDWATIRRNYKCGSWAVCAETETRRPRRLLLLYSIVTISVWSIRNVRNAEQQQRRDLLLPPKSCPPTPLFREACKNRVKNIDYGRLFCMTVHLVCTLVLWHSLSPFRNEAKHSLSLG